MGLLPTLLLWPRSLGLSVIFNFSAGAKRE
jgi:hypothetical protein